MNILRQIHKYVVITAVFLFCFLAVEKTFAQQNEEKIIPYQERLKQQEKQIKQIDSKKDDKLKGLDKLIEKVKNSTTVKQIHDWVNRSTGDSSKDYKADSVTARINVRKNGVKSGGGDPRGEASEDFKDGAESDAFQDIQDRKTFYDCFEPRIIEKRCDYCNPKIVHPDYQNCLPILNTGERWEYWWPEFEIEINNFGISAFKANKRSDLSHDALVKACTASILSGVPEYVRTIINNKQMGQELAGNSGNEIVQRYEKEVKEVSEKINKLCGGTGLGASIPEGETKEAHLYRPQGTYSNQTTTSERDKKNFNGYEFPYKKPDDWPVTPCPIPQNGGMLSVSKTALSKCCVYDFIWNGWKITEDPSVNAYPPIKEILKSEYEDPNNIPPYNDFCFYDTFPLADENKSTEEGKDGEYIILGFTEEDGKASKSVINKPGGGEKINPHLIWRFPLNARKFGKSTGEKYLQQQDLEDLKLSSTTKELIEKLAKLDDYFAIGHAPGFNGDKNKVKSDPHLTQVGAVADLFAGDQSAMTAPASAAITARKAIELFSAIAEKKRPRASKDIKKRMFKYTDTVDKLQIVYPYGSKCFKTAAKELQKGIKLTPLDEKEEDVFKADKFNFRQKGSVRLMFWNKRTACTCPWKSNYTDGVVDTNRPAYQKGWGCQPWRGIGKSDYPVGDGDGQLNGGDDDVKGSGLIENDMSLEATLPFV